MTRTNLQSKRSEHGASLILLVSIIGLAFIVTIGAFLAAASVGRNTVRFTSAKMDVANREDVLMRAILQQTATGIMLDSTQPTDWTTIMENAVYAIDNLNTNKSTNYVDQAELVALGIDDGVIPVIRANTGDTNSATPLDIFQGYQQSEVPFGGTSGLPNDVSLDPNYTQTQRLIDPPLMIWSGDLTLSSATALTTPQEFFLGSRYTPLSGMTLSASYRWAQLTYPAIRFGYKQPGNQFVARRVWWRIPLAYKQKSVNGIDLINRYSSAPAPVNYVLSVYEIPSQLPISGNANLQIGAWGSGSTVTVTGSVYGDQIQLYGGTYDSVSSRQGVTVNNPTTVGTVTYLNSLFDQPGSQPGTREQMALTQPGGVAAPVSVAGNDGKALLVPVMPGNDFYVAAPGTPTHWDLYARPYYRCRIRVIISGTDSNLIYNSVTNTTTAGPINVKVYSSPDTSSPWPLPDQILGFPDSSFGTPAEYDQSTLASSGYMNYTSTNSTVTVPGRNILVIDILKMVQALGNPAQLYSIYIGNPPNPPDPGPPYQSPGIAITDTHDLSAFTNGLSIVTNQTLYLLDVFNQGTTKPPTSIYAPPDVLPPPSGDPPLSGVRYGMSAINPQVNLTGQVAVVATPGPSPTTVNPLSFSGNSSSIPSNNITAKLNEIIDPTPWSTTSQTGLPPITALNLLFTIEKEQTN